MIKNIQGFNGDYTVSDSGVIYSYKSGSRKILKQTKIKNGYLTVKLSSEGKAKTIYVHRLVAESFLRLVEGKTVTNHKNGIKTDNRVENLEWCTYSENLIHAFKNNLNPNVGSNHASSKLNEEQVSEIKLRLKNEKNATLAKEFKVSQQLICDIKKGRRWARVKPMEISFYNEKYGK